MRLLRAAARGPGLGAERSGAERGPGATKEVLGFIAFLAFNLDFLGFPGIVL